MTRPISPLRQRMIDDMTMRDLSPSTQETYIRAVAEFSTFHRRSPDKLGIEHLRAYHLHLVSRGLTANSIWVKMGALRFFYRTTLQRPDIAKQITAETLTTIAADPKHLGANIGIITVLHTWGQNLQHHPHVHCIVPGGGLSPDGQRWIACKPGFFLPVRVLSRLFRRLFLQSLQV